MKGGKWGVLCTKPHLWSMYTKSNVYGVIVWLWDVCKSIRRSRAAVGRSRVWEMMDGREGGQRPFLGATMFLPHWKVQPTWLPRVLLSRNAGLGPGQASELGFFLKHEIQLLNNNTEFNLSILWASSEDHRLWSYCLVTK
jgi:hypothetical protein